VIVGKRKERLFNFKLPLSSAGTLVPITSSRHRPKNKRSRVRDEEAPTTKKPLSLSRICTRGVRGYASLYVHPSGVQKQRYAWHADNNVQHLTTMFVGGGKVLRTYNLPRPLHPGHEKRDVGKPTRVGHRNDDKRLHRVNGTETDGGKDRGRHAAGVGKCRHTTDYILEAMVPRK
jgi:hypothetical protein